MKKKKQGAKKKRTYLQMISSLKSDLRACLFYIELVQRGLAQIMDEVDDPVIKQKLEALRTQVQNPE